MSRPKLQATVDRILDAYEEAWRLSLSVPPEVYLDSSLPFSLHQIGRVLEGTRPGRLDQIAQEVADASSQ